MDWLEKLTMSAKALSIVIVYNPNSTGQSKENAQGLQLELTEKLPDIAVTLRGTTHPGHGETMARHYAQQDKPMILISSSGDGGYHEIINGVLLKDAKNIVTGLLPSGNANDHYSVMSRGDIVKNIISQNFQSIDVLKVTSKIGGKTWTRYAHSYAGIGISPIVADDLTKARPNVITEKWLTLKALFSFEYVKIMLNGHKRHYSSLLFSNIGKMSKVLKVAPNSSPRDGKFEVSEVRFRSKLRLIASLFVASTRGLKKVRSVSSYSFQTINRTLIQLDGEVYTLDAKSDVQIECLKQRLLCVV